MQIDECPAPRRGIRTSGVDTIRHMLRHVVLLRFTGDDAEDIARIVDEVAEALRGLPGQIPAIREYSVQLDAGLAHDNAHLAVIADFDDEAGYAAYLRHPAHVDVLERLIRPSLALRLASQFPV